MNHRCGVSQQHRCHNADVIYMS